MHLLTGTPGVLLHSPVWVGYTDTHLCRRRAPTAGLPVCSWCLGRWSPLLCMGVGETRGCTYPEMGGGDGNAFRMWAGPLMPGWRPPPAAGASDVSPHRWTAASSGWTSLSGLSGPGHTCIAETPSDGPHLFPRSSQAQSETWRNIRR